MSIEKIKKKCLPKAFFFIQKKIIISINKIKGGTCNMDITVKNKGIALILEEEKRKDKRNYLGILAKQLKNKDERR